MKTELIILGCGNSLGVPSINGNWGNCDKNNKKNNRSRCSAVLLKGSNIVLIDTSPDIRHQMIQNKIRSVSSVIFTHDHADQTNGLFELRPFFWTKNEKINTTRCCWTGKSTHGPARSDPCNRSVTLFRPWKMHRFSTRLLIAAENELFECIVIHRPVEVDHGLQRSLAGGANPSDICLVAKRCDGDVVAKFTLVFSK